MKSTKSESSRYWSACLDFLPVFPTTKHFLKKLILLKKGIALYLARSDNALAKHLKDFSGVPLVCLGIAVFEDSYNG